jgi:F0F1-type ATP synthase delta subunit
MYAGAESTNESRPSQGTLSNWDYPLDVMLAEVERPLEPHQEECREPVPEPVELAVDNNMAALQRSATLFNDQHQIALLLNNHLLSASFRQEVINAAIQRLLNPSNNGLRFDWGENLLRAGQGLEILREEVEVRLGLGVVEINRILNVIHEVIRTMLTSFNRRQLQQLLTAYALTREGRLTIERNLERDLETRPQFLQVLERNLQETTRRR